MKELAKAMLGISALGIVLLFLYLPMGRTNIPSIGHFFSERVGVWESARKATYEREALQGMRLLEDSVRVMRDQQGIPHIFAQNDHDALMALGFITARDRLFQMMWNARSVAGQLHQWFGKRYQKQDEAFLRLGLEQAAWNHHNELDKQEYAWIKAYQQGVNDFINLNSGDNGALEFNMFNLATRYWRPVDSFRVLNKWGFQYVSDDHLLAYKQALDSLGSRRFEQLYGISVDQIRGRTSQSIPTEATQTHFESLIKDFNQIFPSGRGVQNVTQIAYTNSNNTRMGVNYVGSLQLPHALYPVRIVTPDRDVFGFTIPGAPIFIVGASRHRSWSLTGKGGSIAFTRLEDDAANSRQKQYPFFIRGVTDDSLTINFSNDYQPVWNVENTLVKFQWAGSQASGIVRKIWELGADTVSHNTITPISGYKLLVNQRDSLVKVYGQSKDAQTVDRYMGNKRAGFSERYKTINQGYNWQEVRMQNLIHSPLDRDLTDLLIDTKIPQQILKDAVVRSLQSKNDRLYFHLREALMDWDYDANRNSGLPIFWSQFMRYMNELVWDEIEGLPMPEDIQWVEKLPDQANDEIFDIKTTPQRENAYDLIQQATEKALQIAQIEYGNFESWNWGTLTSSKTHHATANHSLSTFSSYGVQQSGFNGAIDELKNRNIPYGAHLRFATSYNNYEERPRVSYMWVGGVTENPFSTFHHDGLDHWNNNVFTTFEWKDFRNSDWQSSFIMTPRIR
ncbi:MAG: penicillin acylase family protein [Bacteroidota bacterium]